MASVFKRKRDSARNLSLADVIAGSTVQESLNASRLEKRDSDAYSRVLTVADDGGSVSVAGARSGLQNRGSEAANTMSQRRYGNKPPR